MKKPILIVLLLLAISFFLISFDKNVIKNGATKEAVTETKTAITKPAETQKPDIDPSKFTTLIDNAYFSLPVGRTLIYEGETEDGLERIEISITGETKEVMGVETLVYSDKVWVDGELVEDTKDYLAQDEQGNVWYFGEDVDNYEDGELVDHDGSWLAGADEAQPGIWIKAEHVLDDSYKQEYYKGKAEDMRDVVSIGEPVEIGLGSYTDCVKMYDWTPLESDAKEHKVYCSEVGAMVLETNLVTNKSIELIEIR